VAGAQPPRAVGFPNHVRKGVSAGAEWVGRKAIPHHLHPLILIANQ